jgi:hypothetical protein
MKIYPWSSLEISEAPLPRGYKIIYDPLVASMIQAELPLTLEEPTPEPPHIITRSGVKVYDDWRDNIIVDAEAPPLLWKAKRDTFGAHTSVPDHSRLASENSRLCLVVTWSLSRLV